MSSEAQTIADLATRAAGANLVATPDGRQFLVTPESFTAKDVTDPRGLVPGVPARIKQAVTLQAVDSLVDYVNRFKTETTLLFADIGHNSISGQIDYHGPSAPQNTDHVATMALPYSEEWRTWTAISGKLMDQLEFARFVEENAADVAAPSGADLLDTVRDLQAVRKVNFTKAIRTNTDNENFEYSDETRATVKGGVEVPTKFLLKIPVYFGRQETDVYAFLRWKLDDGALTLGVVLHRAEHIRQAVFKQIVTDAAERTGCPAVFGRPS